jgi:hypothetical protein
MMTKIRTIDELLTFKTFEERFEYLKLVGELGQNTFGYDRWINQRLYSSREWKQVRNAVIIRDNGCDLAHTDHVLAYGFVVHHMNPLEIEHFVESSDFLLDPKYLITTSEATHRALHYGDISSITQKYIPRSPGDTKLW